MAAWTTATPVVTLRPVDAGSWRDVAALTVAPGQERFVAAPTYYLALCAYGDVWQPMSVHDADDSVVGFLMWGIDDEDGSCWLGGVLVDVAHQGRGVGRAAVVEALRTLRTRAGTCGVRAVVPAREPGGEGALREPGVRRDRRGRRRRGRRPAATGPDDGAAEVAWQAGADAVRTPRGPAVRTLLNIIWFVFGGLWLALGYALAGVVFCILIVTIPLGVASFRMARYALWPFGRAVVPKEGAGAGAVVLNVVWILLAGWWLAIMHVITAVAQAITIIGIPLAIANLKMVPISLVPYGKRIVRTDALPPGERPLHSL